MAKAKRVRWECPNELHPAVLGSTRPLRDATVRYCLPCSEATGRLVERVAPALERKRAAKTAVRQSKAEQQRERERVNRENALKVTVLDREGDEFVLDAGELLREAWRTHELRSQQREAWAASQFPPPLPELVIRRGRGRAPKRELPLHERCLPVRQRDTMSGHAQYDGSRIVLTVGPGLGHEWLRAIVVHEATHAACPLDTRHGPQWRSAYWRTVAELYGLPVPTVRLAGQASWVLDEQIAEAVLNARSC